MDPNGRLHMQSDFLNDRFEEIGITVTVTEKVSHEEYRKQLLEALTPTEGESRQVRRQRERELANQKG